LWCKREAAAAGVERRFGPKERNINHIVVRSQLDANAFPLLRDDQWSTRAFRDDVSCRDDMASVVEERSSNVPARIAEAALNPQDVAL
jgi:hypothetical protein